MKTLLAFLVTARDLLFGSVWSPLARGAWCRRQRRHLRVPGGPVAWVPRAALPWAEWGASHGYFELQRMSGLPYLSRAALA
jgi:hypothetical protein